MIHGSNNQAAPPGVEKGSVEMPHQRGRLAELGQAAVPKLARIRSRI